MPESESVSNSKGTSHTLYQYFTRGHIISVANMVIMGWRYELKLKVRLEPGRDVALSNHIRALYSKPIL